METNTENRKNNYIVIYDFLSEKKSDEYKSSFNKLYPKGVTHGKWAEDAIGEFATCFRRGLETIVPFFVLII